MRTFASALALFAFALSMSQATPAAAASCDPADFKDGPDTRPTPMHKLISGCKAASDKDAKQLVSNYNSSAKFFRPSGAADADVALNFEGLGPYDVEICNLSKNRGLVVVDDQSGLPPIRGIGPKRCLALTKVRTTKAIGARAPEDYALSVNANGKDWFGVFLYK